ncbi:MAG TPA: acetylglutamate kinase [Bacteroidia bacterium]|nr:acetylglutamate kinase [Bacteroidia bacterium]
MITVVKLGGNIIDDEKSLSGFLLQFANLPGKKILVHGGGKLATQLAEKMGIKSEMIDGRRVTDAETLKLVTMVYAGWINKCVVAKLQSLNCNAIGLSGADGNLIRSEKRAAIPVDFGFVGDPLENEINSGLLKNLLENGFTPVVAPVTHDGKGQLLNTNADTIASVIASSLAKSGKVQLLYCFEKNGVLKNVADSESYFPELKKIQFDELISSGKIHSGMLPKLKAGFKAKTNGVTRVVIGNAGQLSELAKENSICTSLEI